MDPYGVLWIWLTIVRNGIMFLSVIDSVALKRYVFNPKCIAIFALILRMKTVCTETVLSL